jgi:hypothetical protein
LKNDENARGSDKEIELFIFFMTLMSDGFVCHFGICVKEIRRTKFAVFLGYDSARYLQLFNIFTRKLSDFQVRFLRKASVSNVSLQFYLKSVDISH